ncbi:MAG: outer membrane lipoprotein-sorting protein [Deltaproteobacteria bacterium]|nr:outer membrane lipoprotein-sorting protein [Deltaproteobacteria bacterium]
MLTPKLPGASAPRPVVSALVILGWAIAATAASPAQPPSPAPRPSPSPPTSASSSGSTKTSDVEALLDHVDDLFRGQSSETTLSMTVKTAHYERTMTMKAWSLGTDRTLIRILAPLKEKGSATLKSENAVYTYLPKTDRTIRLTSGMMGGSWMGSHFTNDDLVKEYRLRRDYTATITFEGPRDGQRIVEITLKPRPEAAVVWGKLVLTIDADARLPLEYAYFDEDMRTVRVATFSDVADLGGRRLPRTMTMKPTDKPDEFTRITYETMKFDVPLAKDQFSVSALRRR